MRNWLKRLFRAAAGDVHSLDSQTLATLLREANGGGFAGDRAVNESTAMRMAAYAGCVRLLSGAVANLPWRVKRRVDARRREIVDDHQVALIFSRRPNSSLRQAVAFKRMITAHKLNFGNFYALKVISPVTRKLTDLLPLNPTCVMARQMSDGTIVYDVTTHRGVKRFARDDVFHVMGPTSDGVRGVSVLSFARETLTEGMWARDNGVSLFKNQLRIPGSVSHPGKLSPQAKGNIADSFKQYMPGGAKEDEVMVLEEAMKFMPHMLNPVDAQWIDARKLSRVEIAMFFGVPPHMLGDTEKTTSFGTGIEEMTIGFVNFTLADHIADIQDAVDAQLLVDPRYDAGLYLDIDLKGLLAGDFQKRMQGYALGRQWGWLSENDVLGLEDMNPIENGDNYLTPTTHVVTGEPAPQPASQQKRTDKP